MFEDSILEDLKSYDEEGNLRGSIGFTPPQPTRLQWDFSDSELVATIDEAFESSQRIIKVKIFLLSNLNTINFQISGC